MTSDIKRLSMKPKKSTIKHETAKRRRQVHYPGNTRQTTTYPICFYIIKMLVNSCIYT